MNYLDLPWFTLNYLKSPWIILNYLELPWITLNYLDLHWITLNNIELSCITLNYLELSLNHFQSSIYPSLWLSDSVTEWVTWQILEMLTHLKRIIVVEKNVGQQEWWSKIMVVKKNDCLKEWMSKMCFDKAMLFKNSLVETKKFCRKFVKRKRRNKLWNDNVDKNTMIEREKKMCSKNVC